MEDVVEALLAMNIIEYFKKDRNFSSVEIIEKRRSYVKVRLIPAEKQLPRDFARMYVYTLKKTIELSLTKIRHFEEDIGVEKIAVDQIEEKFQQAVKELQKKMKELKDEVIHYYNFDKKLITHFTDEIEFRNEIHLHITPVFAKDAHLGIMMIGFVKWFPRENSRFAKIFHTNAPLFFTEMLFDLGFASFASSDKTLKLYKSFVNASTWNGTLEFIGAKIAIMSEFGREYENSEPLTEQDINGYRTVYRELKEEIDSIIDIIKESEEKGRVLFDIAYEFMHRQYKPRHLSKDELFEYVKKAYLFINTYLK